MDKTTVKNNLIKMALASGSYKVDELGNIWTLYGKNNQKQLSWRLLGKTIQSNGYINVTIRNVKFRYHSVVYQALIGDLIPGFVINHKDSNKKNNHPDNLEQITQQDNISHMREFHKDKFENITSTFRKFDSEQIKEIRNKYEAGNQSYKKLAIDYSVGETTIERIIKRESYKNVA
jgi:anti-sigma28 factor (negative regulator of flagellin synthesis)